MSGLTRAFSGSQTNAGANTWGSNALTAQNQTTAITSNAFFNFKITTAVPGVSLSNIGAYSTWLHEDNAGSSPTNIFSGIWQYSLDGTNFTNIGSSFSLGTVSQGAGNPQSSVDLSVISSLQSMPSGTAVDLRLVAWGAGYGANYAGFNSFQSGDDLIVNGTVPVPEPSTCVMALAGLACGGYLLRRRQNRAEIAPANMIPTQGEQVAITGLPPPVVSRPLNQPPTPAPLSASDRCHLPPANTSPRSADKHPPEAHWRNPSILSPAVTATGYGKTAAIVVGIPVGRA